MPPGQQVEELADLWEVLAALIQTMGSSEEEVRKIAATKRRTRGGFDRGLG